MKKVSRRIFLKSGLVSLPVLSAARADRYQVLILGDSISIGYTPEVKEILKAEADVFRPPVNCQGTRLGVQKINEWIGDRKWDVIHFNFGLHDLKHVDPVTGLNSTNPHDPQQSPPKQYRKNLRFIVQRLKGTGARLVFATSTPYPDKPEGPLRRDFYVKEYNRIALKVMRKNGIAVNDLYGDVLPALGRYQLPGNVHFKKEGNRFLGEKVAGEIRKAMRS